MLKYAVLILWRKKGIPAHFYAFCISGLEYARIESGGSHSILATDGIQDFWVPPFFQD